jgi:hypothetical protein
MVADKADVLMFPAAVVLEDTVAQAEKERHLALVAELMVQVEVEVAVTISAVELIWVLEVEAQEFLGKDLMGLRTHGLAHILIVICLGVVVDQVAAQVDQFIFFHTHTAAVDTAMVEFMRLQDLTA